MEGAGAGAAIIAAGRHVGGTLKRHALHATATAMVGSAVIAGAGMNMHLVPSVTHTVLAPAAAPARDAAPPAAPALASTARRPHHHHRPHGLPAPPSPSHTAAASPPASPSPSATAAPLPPPELQVSTTAVQIGPYGTGRVAITAGSRAVSWQASSSSASLVIDDPAGLLGPGQSATVTVRLARAGPAGGAWVTLTWQDGQSAQVRVTWQPGTVPASP